MFTIYDDKAKAYLPPFFLPEVGQAIRTFADCVNDPKGEHAFSRHPADYTLFLVGEFDQSSGRMEVALALEALANGLELRSRVEDIVRRTAQGAKS